MSLLRFHEFFGTLGDDVLSSSSFSTTFGLTGNDRLASVPGSEYNFLAGGAGNDTYIVGLGSAATIVDTGGVDHIIAINLGINSPNTWALTIDGGRHLLAFDIVSGTQVAIANWRSSINSIESITLSDGSFNLSQIVLALSLSPNFLGDRSFQFLVDRRILPATFTSGSVLEFIQYVTNREIAKINELNQPPPPVVTSQTFNLTLLVDAGVLGAGPVLLEGLNETRTTTNGVLTSHTVTYAGTHFNFADIDHLVMTVTRNGEFTDEFAREIADYAPAFAGITYQAAVQLVGVQNIQSVLVYVAGADGSFVT